MQLGRKGGLGWNGLLACGMGGGGEKASLISDVSTSRTQESESGCSQGGGIMLQRRWRLRRRANQRGRVVRRGGRRAFVGPCDGLVLVIARWVRRAHLAGKEQGALTPSSSRLSRRWRGTIVTSSISQMKAISAGSRPVLCGNAMLGALFVVYLFSTRVTT